MVKVTMFIFNYSAGLSKGFEAGIIASKHSPITSFLNACAHSHCWLTSYTFTNNIKSAGQLKWSCQKKNPLINCHIPLLNCPALACEKKRESDFTYRVYKHPLN